MFYVRRYSKTLKQFFPRTNKFQWMLLLTRMLTILVRLFSHWEEYFVRIISKYIEEYLLFFVIFLIGIENIAPFTSSKFNKISESISSGNFLSIFYRHCFSNTICLITTVVILPCLINVIILNIFNPFCRAGAIIWKIFSLLCRDSTTTEWDPT